ncbi:MAG: membrane-bound lytic murein transglycosylase MltF [Gammaproteobacteria bacterium]|nr:membrane-bound lytic murein transglycosylase MltF [Gammaproteobacteria bacterium]
MKAGTQRRYAVLLAAGLLACGALALWMLAQRPPVSLLERIQRSGELVVATRLGPTTYHAGAAGPDGFEYALAKEFGRTLGVGVRFEFPADVEALLDATTRGTVHIAAAGLSINEQRNHRVHFTLPYQYQTEQLVYRRGSRRPRSLADVEPGELHVIAGSGQEAALIELRDTAYPQLRWERLGGTGPETLLAALDQGGIRYTLAGANEVELSRRLYRYVAVAFELDEPRALAWALPPTQDRSLLDAANAFLAEVQADGRLQRLYARYYGHAGRMNFVETRDFWRNVRDRLPRYRGYFERAGEITGIDWRLLAAIGYQESHWQADAISPTGVRGIMMLTEATATQMKVGDRDDAEQSIVGGARYLRVIEKKIPRRIREPNRMWLTLAGYNVGFGHLEDARILTERDGANPDLWMEVKQRLPLLADKAHYSTVKRGFARGQEPVDYVDNIRNYYDLLVWYTTTTDANMRHRLLAEEPGEPVIPPVANATAR